VVPLRAAPSHLSLVSLATLCVACVVNGAVGLDAGPRARARPRCTGRDLVAATYNVRFDSRGDGPHRWRFRRFRVGEQIRALGADLIGLQEVKAGQLDDLERMLPGYEHVGVGRDDGARAGEFSPLFYWSARFAREDSGTFWLSPTPHRPRQGFEMKPWGTWHNRIATWALLREHSTGERFLVLNTHMDHWSELARVESARMIADFVGRSRARHVIVMGDINARAGSKPHRLLAASLRDTASAPSVELARSDTSVTSWTDLGAPNHHIDHIFVSPSLRPLSYKVIDRRFFYSGGTRYPSDHLPVRTRLCMD
jgi:endonuclease/exonuclease/phosphatase family metal-dependent hydrolase